MQTSRHYYGTTTNSTIRKLLMLFPLCLKRKICFTVLLLVCSIAHAESLSEIFNLAVQVDTTLQQANDNRLATMTLLPQARAGLLPVIDFTANTTYNNTNNPQLVRYNTFYYGANLATPLLNLAAWFQYRQVDDQIKSAVALYEDAKQDLIVRVVTQYFTILKALDDLFFTRSERKAFARQLEQTKQKFNAGVIAITDVNVAQARYDNAHAQEISAANALSDQEEIMGQITGVPAKNINILKYSINLHRPQPDDIDYWVKASLDQNYEIKSKRYDVAVARKNISIQRAGHYPTIQANGSTNVSKSVPPAPVVANDNSIGLTFTLPLFNSGKIVSQTTQAKYQFEIARQKEIESERNVVSNTRQAYRGILTQISQVKALQQSVISNKSALDATQAAFDVGTRTIVDVLNAQTDLLRAQSDLAKAKYDYIVESFKLKRYAGLLTVEDVNIVNAWLVPAPKNTYDVPDIGK